MTDFDATNKYAVQIQGMRIAIGLPPIGAVSHDDALLLAAWIVAISGKEKRFREILNAVKDS